MKSRIALIFLLGMAICSIVSCSTTGSTTGFEEVRDPKLKRDLVSKWSKNKSSQMVYRYPNVDLDWRIKNGKIPAGTVCYRPDRKTYREVEKVKKIKGIRDSEIIGTYYFALDGGSHIIFLKTEQKGDSARFHCIGLNRDSDIDVYWIQFQDEGKEDVIETIQLPKKPNKTSLLTPDLSRVQPVVNVPPLTPSSSFAPGQA